MKHAVIRWAVLVIALILGTVGSSQTFTFGDVQKLPAFGKNFADMTPDERLKWLQEELESATTPIETYRFHRMFAMESSNQGQNQLAAEYCRRITPLRDDFVYRNYCNSLLYTDFFAYSQQMKNLIHDAREANDNINAAIILSNLAWRQSQEGDIAGAFTSYETALAIAPNDQTDIINNLMFDSATNYIVHGDDFYVEKGIKLLENVRKNYREELKSQKNEQRIAELEYRIHLAYFNSGVAYMLHLYDYEKALNYFQYVNPLNNFLSVNSLSYSALAAAKLGQIDQAKRYIEMIGDKRDGDPVFDQYLLCYRQLAIQYWDKSEQLDACMNLHPNTAVEVKVDLYKRLSKNPVDSVQRFGLEKLRDLYVTTLEPQLRKRGSVAASNVEIKRLQRESELKSVVLEKEKQLSEEREARHSTQQKLFVSLFTILLFSILLVFSQLRQKKKLAEQYQRMSVLDSLTNLGNRRFIEQQIDRELAFVARSIQEGHEIALGIYLFDIDRFKQINDTYGHHAGDEVLKTISDRVKRVTRETDLFARWGGEEFIFIARLDTNHRTVELADRILKAINSEPMDISGSDPINVTCTIGAVKYPFIKSEATSIWPKLISLADAALYYGKEMGRNRWVVVNNEKLTELTQLDDLICKPLSQAISTKEISIHSSD